MHKRKIIAMLSAVDLQPFIERYKTENGTPVIKHVSVGGESGPEQKTPYLLTS